MKISGELPEQDIFIEVSDTNSQNLVISFQEFVIELSIESVSTMLYVCFRNLNRTFQLKNEPNVRVLFRKSIDAGMWDLLQIKVMPDGKNQQALFRFDAPTIHKIYLCGLEVCRF